MTAWVMRLWTVKGMLATPFSNADKARMIAGVAKGDGFLGTYIEDCDVNAHFGRGQVTFTTDLAKAKRFPTEEAAVEFWKRQSTLVPQRPDGQPNRPLTAFNVTFDRIEE